MGHVGCLYNAPHRFIHICIMAIFYCENLDTDSALLNEEESKHAVQVLRLAVGSRVEVIDGKGTFCYAVIKVAHHKKCELQIVERIQNFQNRNYQLHIAIAPTKQMERFEWFLEKAVELGINEITPLICKNSVRSNMRMDRLEKIILSAVKQSKQAYLPILNSVIDFEQFLKENRDADKVIAYCETGKEDSLQLLISKNKSVVVLIGPEGDFTPTEVELAISLNYIPVSLGETRLRTETAGVYACSVLRILNS